MAEIEPPGNPYPGLRPFEMDEHHLFFGRDRQCDELLRQLRHHRFLAVVGSSGCGKSSLVKAGVLPGLLGGQMVGAGSSWRVASLRPGSDPIGTLAAALDATGVLDDEDGSDEESARLFTETTLRRGPLGLIEVTRQGGLAPGDNLLILVDQLEELFRFTPSGKTSSAEDDPAAFVELLLRASRQVAVPIYVMVTMRSDYIGECSRFRGLPETINNGLFLVPRMTRDQVREAITGPAAVAGAEVSSRLLQRLLGVASHDPDLLPVLQHVLMRTWDRRAAGNGTGPLDLPDYEAVGGIDDALSNHADKAYEELADERAREIAEVLLKRLTERESGDRDVRRPSRIDEVCAVADASEEQVLAVIETFRRPGRSFIMPPPEVDLTADTTIDISHESLMWGWQRLKRWVDEEARSARRYRRLAESARLYREAKTGLMRDPELSVTIEWRRKAQPNQAWAERYAPGFEDAVGFLEESREARAAEIAEKERARQQELEQEIRRRKVLTGMLVALGVALVVAVISTSIARYQRAKAEQHLVTSYWFNAAAATIEHDRLRAVHYLSRALKHDHQSRLLEPGQVGINALTGVRLVDMVSLPDTSGLVFSDYTHHILTWGKESTACLCMLSSSDNRHQLKPLTELKLKETGARFKGGSFAQSNLVTWSDSGTVRVWSIPDGTEVASISHDDCATTEAAISQDGSTIATWCDEEGQNKTVRLWRNDEKGYAPDGYLEHDFAVRGAGLNEDGSTALTWGVKGYGIVTYWSTANGKSTRELIGKLGSPIAGAVLSPSQELTLTWSDDGKVCVYDRWGDQESKVNHQGKVAGAAFVQGDSRFLTWSSDRSARLWSTDDGVPISAAMLHSSPVQGASLNTTQEAIYTWTSLPKGLGLSMRIWDVVKMTEGAAKPSLPKQSWRVVLEESTARLFRQGKEVETMVHDARVTGYKKYPEHDLIITWCRDDTVWFWILDGAQVDFSTVHHEQLNGAELIPEHDKVLSWGGDGTARLWQIDGSAASEPMLHQDSVIGARIIRDHLTDQQQVLTWSFDRTARLWNIEDGSPAARPMLHSYRVLGATVSPSNRYVLTWCGDWATLWHVAQGVPVALAVLQPDCRVTEVLFESELQPLVICSSGSALRWNLNGSDHPPNLLSKRVELTTGTTMDDAGNLSVIDADEWLRIRNTYNRTIYDQLQ
jgi:WD40 repeat protein/energy-coupling factor transporter ATP-binding protein EcfA2